MYKKEFSEFTVSMTNENVSVKLQTLIDYYFTSHQESFAYIKKLTNLDFAFMNLHL